MIKDHLGNEFESMSAMCRHWGILPSTYLNRTNKLGMSLKNALTTRVMSNDKVEDHLGNTFSSKKEMCKYYNISISSFTERLKKGMSLKDALTIPVKKKYKAKDHLGNTFSSKKEMCEYYNISISSFTERIQKGLSLEEALTNEKTSGVQNICDHNGNTFRTKTEMAEHYGISEKTYASRRRKGLSKKDALTMPAYYNNPKGPFVDHEGNEFPTMKAMAEHWGQSDTILYDRLKRMSLKDALTKPSGWRDDIYDHRGQQYKSLTDMCNQYGMNITTYQYRINSGWPLNAALLLKKNIHLKNNMRISDNYIVIQNITPGYYECVINSEKIICSQKQILSDIADIIEKERNAL